MLIDGRNSSFSLQCYFSKKMLPKMLLTAILVLTKSTKEIKFKIIPMDPPKLHIYQH